MRGWKVPIAYAPGNGWKVPIAYALRNGWKGFAAAAGIVGLILATGFVSYGKEERTKIDKIELSIESAVKAGGTGGAMRISLGNGGYNLDSYEITNEPDRWSSYDCPRVTIYLSAHENYYFKSQGSGYFKFKGDVQKFVKAGRGDEDSSLWVVVDMKPLSAKIGNPSDLEWSSNGMARWTKGYKAKKYEVALYREDTRMKKETTTASSYDFSGDMTGDYAYSFKVRATDGGKIYGDWIESEVFAGGSSLGLSGNQSESDGLDPAGNSSSESKWIQDAQGWWYQEAGGKWPASAWREIDGNWYYFDGEGYIMTGLHEIEGQLYYFNGDGVMQTGWVQIGNNWYNFGDNGCAFRDTTTPDGYKVGRDGVMID